MARAKGTAKKSPKTEPSPPAESVVGTISTEQDRLCYIAVLEDKRANRLSTQSNLRGAVRYEKARNLKTALDFMQAVDRKYLNEWTGRQNTLLNVAAERYGAPILGRTWSVPALVHWLFEWLAKNGRFVSRSQMDGQAEEAGSDSPWMEELRKERCLMERIRRRELEKSLISAHVVRQAWQIAGSAMRVGAEQMKRERLDRAVEIYNEALDNAERKLDQFFAEYENQAEPKECVSDGQE